MDVFFEEIKFHFIIKEPSKMAISFFTFVYIFNRYLINKISGELKIFT